MVCFTLNHIKTFIAAIHFFHAGTFEITTNNIDRYKQKHIYQLIMNPLTQKLKNSMEGANDFAEECKPAQRRVNWQMCFDMGRVDGYFRIYEGSNTQEHF